MKIPFLHKDKYDKSGISYLHQRNQSFSKNHRKIYNDNYEVFYNLQRDIGVLGKVIDFGCMYLIEFLINLLLSTTSFIILISLIKSILERKFNSLDDPIPVIFITITSISYLMFWGVPTFYKLYKWHINSSYVQKNYMLLVNEGEIIEGYVIAKNQLTTFHFDLVYEYTSLTGKKITGTYWTHKPFDHKLPVRVYILVANDELHILL